MKSEAHSGTLEQLEFLPTAEPLFDALPDVVFFVKNAEARYVAVNHTLVRRAGLESKQQLLGKTTLDVFPAPFSKSYHEQDLHVLQTGEALRDMLELHLYIQGGAGWCVTTKLPVVGEDGAIAGIVGVSNDVHAPAMRDTGYRELAEAVDFIREHLDQPLRVDLLAGQSGLSVYQFEQRMKKVFHLTVGQFISKTRIERACERLRQPEATIVDVAHSCGFADHSAFTRQFKATTGLTPSEYRGMATTS